MTSCCLIIEKMPLGKSFSALEITMLCVRHNFSPSTVLWFVTAFVHRFTKCVGLMSPSVFPSHDWLSFKKLWFLLGGLTKTSSSTEYVMQGKINGIHKKKMKKIQTHEVNPFYAQLRTVSVPGAAKCGQFASTLPIWYKYFSNLLFTWTEYF